jgi:hypothetical protein
MRRKKSKYDIRYPPIKDWNKISVRSRSLCPYCSLPGCTNLSKQLHHIIYVDAQHRPLNYLTADNFTPLLGVLLFPVCLYHHGNDYPDQVHHPLNWNPGSMAPPRLDAYQKNHMVLELRKGFSEKYPKN